MARLLALYAPPADPTAFDAWYFGRHVPLAKGLPGLRRYEVSRGPVMGLAGPAPYHLVATLYFDSLTDLQAAVQSPQGQACAADVANFAMAGVQLLVFEDAVV